MDYSPYEGFELDGSILEVYLRGVLSVKDGEVTGEDRGRYLHRKLPDLSK